MCGFVGFICNAPGVGLEVVRKMADTIRHRGPDDGGTWIDESEGLALAHSRLAIVDRSPEGHQPMVSADGRYVLVFNGEIYNHLDIRLELKQSGVDIAWRGHSDTETLLAAFSYWGVGETLSRTNGMFALALWDRENRCLYLARDRMGEKPLYYGKNAGVFLFGSELKALEAYPGWQAKINRSALALFMRFGYVPAPWSIYENINKIEPAHYVVINENGRNVSKPICYWDLSSIAEATVGSAENDTEKLVDELESLLKDAVKVRMAADVPLGAFLSGGNDSTAIVALMQAQSDKPVKTFSIGFHEPGFNEAEHAKAVASYLGTDHTELYVTAEQAMAVIPNLPLIYDEPFADSSQIPTFLVSQLAREHVTVSLSGDGGDELFFGYERYFHALTVWSELSRIPYPLRRFGGFILNRLPRGWLEKLATALLRGRKVKDLSERLPRWVDLASRKDGVEFYRELVSIWKNPNQVVLNVAEPDTIMSRSDELPKLPSLAEQMMYLDMVTYLPGDILTKVDRASMAVSLEARVPMLDHRLVEFALRVPMASKYQAGKGKWLLKKMLDRYVPRSMMERPKMGFSVPIGQWLTDPLRDWAEALLDESRLKEEGFFDAATIRLMWEKHLAGDGQWHPYLWNVLMFQAWFESKKKMVSVEVSENNYLIK